MGHGSLLIYLISEALGLSTTVSALHSSGIKWGDAESRHGFCNGVLASVWLFGLNIASLPGTVATKFRGDSEAFSQWAFTQWAFSVLGFLTFFILFSTAIINPVRGTPYLAGVLGAFARAFIFAYFSLAPSEPLKLALIQLLVYKTRYLHHQRLVFCIASQPQAAFYFGYHLNALRKGEKQLTLVILASLFGVVLVYTNIMLRRRRRHLPPGLARARFVRLGYLGKLIASGKNMSRRQDLPQDAFGDASLAAHLIIVSHRWFDPRTCDICSSACPQGLKLTNLMARLEKHFMNRFIGGWDVVLFFDFMSVPQIGLHEDGSIIPRTEEEKHIFDECLPVMGTLYSTFPVLVLSEDSDENNMAIRYIDSGWCACELTLAMLGRSLDQYSYEQLQKLKRQSQIGLGNCSMDSIAANQFTIDAQTELGTKHFLHESDRQVALGIIKGFHFKRLLVDAILRKDRRAIQRKLRNMESQGLLGILDEPVDATLNTLLHLAVSVNCAGAVQLLLQFGANGKLRNLRGDTPSQCFLFPRCSAAATLCRFREHAPILKSTSLSFDFTDTQDTEFYGEEPLDVMVVDQSKESQLLARVGAQVSGEPVVPEELIVL